MVIVGTFSRRQLPDFLSAVPMFVFEIINGVRKMYERRMVFSVSG